MLNRKQIEFMKKRYVSGTMVKLYHMTRQDDMPSGIKGKVRLVDDIGQIHVDWENGRSLALDIKADRFEVVEEIEDLAEDRFLRFGNEVNDIMAHMDFVRLQESCNGGNPQYAAEKLLELHQKFTEVYGEGYVDESNGMILVPGVIRGRNTGKQALALLLIDLEGSGEHWGTTVLTEVGPLISGNVNLPKEQKLMLKNDYVPYDYWYTPMVERDYHINLGSMPESVIAIRKLVDESRALIESPEHR